ncbi:nucleotide exchange factor GrpE [bacterium]|jgi:molecular chaperone GrpE|nr:nucleotide exchange factor GrpE [bacterium]MBT4649439.1 nucleotide exchange factor GrpE [bacterium]
MSEKKDLKQENKKPKKLSREELEIQAAEHLAGWQKALADYQNLQRESGQKISNLNNLLTNNLVLELLPIFDNYQIAINHIPEAEKTSSWAVGLEHILKMWETFLSDHSVTRIKTLGEEFNPHIHEALDQVNEEDKKDQEIVEEKQAGFMLNEDVIRPAKVIINNK